MDNLTPDDLPLVLVAWNDANTDNEAVTLENVHQMHKPMVVHTLGWLLQDDDVGLTLVNEFYDYSYRGRTFIPKAMVESITPFKLSKPRKPKSCLDAPPSSPASSA